MTEVFRHDILNKWVKECVDKKVFPIEISITIDKEGKSEIIDLTDGRDKRSRWIKFQTDKFSAVAKIAPPPTKTQAEIKAFQKMWVKPFEEFMRQILFQAGKDWQKLTPDEKYTKPHALAFSLAVKEIIAKMKEQELTYSDPNSTMKVGINVISTNDFHRRALARMGKEVSTEKE